MYISITTDKVALVFLSLIIDNEVSLGLRAMNLVVEYNTRCQNTIS